MNLNLNGKKALVFGSSAGIGRAVAESLIAEGAQVVLNGRNEEKLLQIAKEIKAENIVCGDLTKEGESARITKKAIELLGGLDIIITNTGGPAKASFLEVSTEQWNTDFQSLWMSVVDSIKEALPGMQKKHYGRVLMITSIAAKEPLPGLTTSNGLRAGLEGLAKSMANEFSKDGITFNLLLPGYTNTERIQGLNLSEEKIKEMVPMGRLGDPQELADLASFLASEKGAYITGQSIAIDGGVMRGH